jgi:excisionase family DNA binding protein
MEMSDTRPNEGQSVEKQFALLTAREAAAYLRISLSTLNRMEHSGAVTSLRTPGKHRRYTLEMLNACLSHGVSHFE